MPAVFTLPMLWQYEITCTALKIQSQIQEVWHGKSRYDNDCMINNQLCKCPWQSLVSFPKSRFMPRIPQARTTWYKINLYFHPFTDILCLLMSSHSVFPPLFRHSRNWWAENLAYIVTIIKNGSTGSLVFYLRTQTAGLG